MGYTFDFFVGHLECEQCGAVSPADSSTNIQTKIAIDTSLAAYGVGDKVDLDIGYIDGTGYFCVKEPEEPSTFTLIDSWECPTCFKPFNWVLIGFDNGRIVSMKAVKLDNKIREIVNYVTDDCEYAGWTVIDGNFVCNEDQKP